MSVARTAIRRAIHLFTAAPSVPAHNAILPPQPLRTAEAAPTALNDRKTSMMQRSSSRERIRNLLAPRDLPSLVTYGVALTGLATTLIYAYLFGYYEEFGVTPEEAGIGQADLLRRPLFVAVLYIGWAAAGGLALLWFPVAPAVDRSEQGGRSRFWKCSALRFDKRVFVFLPVIALAVTAVPSSLYATYLAGHHDARKAIFRKECDEYTSNTQILLGRPVPRLIASWIGAGPSPLKTDADYVLLLGQSGGVTVLMDLNSCSVLRLPSAGVSTVRPDPSVVATLDKKSLPKLPPSCPRRF